MTRKSSRKAPAGEHYALLRKQQKENIRAKIGRIRESIISEQNNQDAYKRDVLKAKETLRQKLAEIAMLISKSKANATGLRAEISGLRAQLKAIA